MSKNIGADTFEIVVNVGVCISQNGQSLFPEVSISEGIGLLSGNVKVLGAVQLNDQLLLGNVEIHNVRTDDLLAMDCDGKCFQKNIP